MYIMLVVVVVVCMFMKPYGIGARDERAACKQRSSNLRHVSRARASLPEHAWRAACAGRGTRVPTRDSAQAQ